MNHTPSNQTVTGGTGERKVDLQKAVEKMHEDLKQFDKYYNFAKTTILESLNKFEVVLSQMSTLVAIAHEICTDGRVKIDNSDACEEDENCKQKGFTNNSYFSVSSNSSEGQNSENPKKKFKLTLPSPKISVVNEKAPYSCQPGTSTEKNRTEIQILHPADSSFQNFRRACAVNQRISKHVTFSQGISPAGSVKTKDSDASAVEAKNKTKNIVINNEAGPSNESSSPSQKFGRICAGSETRDLQIYPHEQEGAENLYDTDNEAVIIALDKTKGVLSREDFNSYLLISVQVKDPVQLAKISFTQNIEHLYYQLLSFSFNLKNENDRLQEENRVSQTNRKLEERLQAIITAFQNEHDRNTEN